MKKSIIIWILLFTGGITMGWGADSNGGKIKLPQEILSMKHDSLRLQKLDNLINQTITNLDERLFYINEFLQEAELQNNKRSIAKAYLLHIYFSFNKQDGEMVNQWASKLEPLARNEKFYDLLFSARQCVIETLLIRQDFELAEQKAEEMLAETQKLNHIDGIVAAYKCLAGAYRATYRFEQSAQILETAYALSPKMKDTKSKLEIITYLIAIYKRMNDQPNWLKYLHIKEKEIKTRIRKDPGTKEFYKGELMQTYISYLGYYIESKQKEQAAHYKQLVEEYKCDQYNVYRYHYNRVMADYYLFTEQWDKALEYRIRHAEIMKPMSYREYPYILSNIADILFLMGREKEALETAKEVLTIKDSVQVLIFSRQIEQIRSNYDFNQNALEQARLHRYFQYSVLGIVLILIIILSFFAYKYNDIKRNLTKSEKKIRQIAENVQKATRTKERFLSNMSYAIRTPLNEVVNNSLLLASKKQIEKEERTKAAQIILNTSADLMKLVEEILDLSRLESGKMKFNVSKVNVNTLVRDVIRIYTSANIKFTTSLPESQELWVQMDGNRLIQVLNSLLSGTEEGKTIGLELKLMDDNIVSIQVFHTVFASPEPTQDIIIRNEINRMIIEYFGGHYTIVPEAVCFTLKMEHPTE